MVPKQVSEPEEEEQEEEEEKPVEEEHEEEEDDRVSVKEEVEHVAGPPEEKKEEKVDIDDIQDKTAAQLREMLTKKGIPFGKRDSKPILIQLLKATA